VRSHILRLRLGVLVVGVERAPGTAAHRAAGESGGPSREGGTFLPCRERRAAGLVRPRCRQWRGSRPISSGRGTSKRSRPRESDRHRSRLGSSDRRGQSAVRISSTRPPQAHCSAQRRHDGCHRVEPPRHSRDRGGASRAPRVPRRRRRSRRVRLVLGRAGAIFRQALREARGGGWRRRAPRARVPPFSRAPRARARTHLGGTSARASVSSPRPRGVRAAPRRHAGHRYPSPIIRGAPCAFFFRVVANAFANERR
jgi:hypothetical protein